MGSRRRITASRARRRDSSYIESVTILVDDDDAGRRHAGDLAERLRGRVREVRLAQFGENAG